MNSLLTLALLTSTTAIPEGSLAGHAAVELQYRGKLTQLSRSGESTEVKEFDFYVVARRAGTGHRCFYTVTERGGGGWAWPERSGEMLLNEANRIVEGRPGHVLHTHDGTKYPVELAQPLFLFADRLEAGRRWASGSLAWEVQKQATVQKRDCWEVSATDRFGRRQQVWVEAGGSLVIAAERRVVMGRGDEFHLRVELTSQRPLEGTTLESITASADSLVALSARLKRKAGETHPELSADQIRTTLAALPSLVESSEKTPLKTLVTSIVRDVQAQNDRASDLENLSRKFVGKAAPQFTLPTLQKSSVTSETQKNRITVLHFWSYQGDPLEEPYGQVGYLDYLKNKRGKLGVDIIGIAVNEDFASPRTAGTALRSVRKLRDFMNVSYTIATDSGTQLKKFGDPRSLGATLPLWVVIGADGTVAHYHVGFYSIKPDEGLKPLDEVLIRLIREQRSAADQ